ncbi:MAG: hypothetical protein N4A57_01090 [Anaeromicrobium sp.]|jgi:endonuclease/exonuclease/phosphatase family metal-dependent hydrolase|uniref:hypothetical protein n=1 Tax=Anaeromicrobium sp. TaxID=1929132 RepID=UPI0025EC0BE5|nr:hypothetical protein [Anaeromicrobium sp.]MCT4592860.1 hypothetical protein [Anaeromicrobium sp.]
MNYGYMVIVLGSLILVIGSWAYIQLFSFKPKKQERLKTNIKTSNYIKKNQSISILTWNIGYGGLGNEADFFMDGGKNIFPKSKNMVYKHLNNIGKFIKSYPSDIYLFQEVALESKITFYINNLEKLKSVLKAYNYVYSPSLYIKSIPILGRLISGNTIFSTYVPSSSTRIALPLERKGLTGILNQKYNFVVQRFPIESSSKEWVIVNIHLAAFDKNGNTRNEQLKEIKEFTVNEYKKGNYVIIGGDWNHRLIGTSFNHDTPKKHLFWVKDMPREFKPEGWKWGVDKYNPTVRTLEKPYIKDKNYTCVIDGFLVSPNIEIVEINGFNLEFKDTDHHPVSIRIRPKAEENNLNISA